MSIRPFHETLNRLRGGDLCLEAQKALAEIVLAVENTGKAGRLTITLDVKKLSRSGALEIIDKVAAKVPEEQALTTLLFSTPEGNLLSEDPRQQSLDLKQAAIPNAASARPLSVVGEK